MSASHDYAIEAVETLLAVGPSRGLFNRLVDEGAYGDEHWTITGDDFASMCHAISEIAEYLGVDWRRQ